MNAKNIVPEKRGNIIFRQELSSITPQCGPKCGLIFNFGLCCIFLALGISIVITSSKSFEVKIDYTDW